MASTSPIDLGVPSNRELTGGDLLAKTLHHLSVRHAFGLHGGHLDAFLLGCVESGVSLIDTRHEATAVQAAEGYAKISGKTGVAFVTANSGFSNALAGLASASADRSPVLVITSSPPLRDAETNALQGLHDQVLVASPLVKWAHRVTNVEEIPRIAAYAFRMAGQGKKGPVLLDVPIDVLFSPPVVSRIAWGALTSPATSLPGPDIEALKKLADAWTKAKAPAIITGTGTQKLSTELAGLAEATNTPIFYSNKLSTCIPFSHPLRGGPATLLAASPTKPDFVLLLAARTGFLLAGRSDAIVPLERPGVVLAQVDLDGAEIGRSHAVSHGIVSDAGKFCTAFTDLVASRSITFPKNEQWISTIKGMIKAPLPWEDEPKTNAKDGFIHPYHGVKALMDALPHDSIIMIDGGEAGQWASMLAERAQPHLVLVPPGYLGFLGNGWGYTLGAAIAEPDRLIVNIHGDGSAGFHIQELDTMARFGMKVLTVVVNNECWGMSVNGQDIVYEKVTEERPAVRLSPHCRYEIVAQGFGCEGVRVHRYEDIGEAVGSLAKGAKGGRPGLLNLMVSRKPTTPATSGMVGMTDDPNVIVVPYYDNVPKPFYK